MNSNEFIDLILSGTSKRIPATKMINYVNKQSDHGLRPLHYASFRGNINAIEKLISYGANVDLLTRKGLGVMHLASQADQPCSLVYFVEKFQIKLDNKDKFGSTPLHWACYTGSENVVIYLLYRYQNYLDINSQDNEGLTPLHLAVMAGNIL
jgi:ankyrin repeat protein